jgi:hypothetical protein
VARDAEALEEGRIVALVAVPVVAVDRADRAVEERATVVAAVASGVIVATDAIAIAIVPLCLPCLRPTS